MPYRIDIYCSPDDALEQLVQWGALDIAPVSDGIAAIIPDSITPDAVTDAFGIGQVRISRAVARDDGSVWMLVPRAIRIGTVQIAPPGDDGPPDVLRLIDSTAFGTGHHPTTALCIEALEDILTTSVPNSVLDVGTGSGILALSALVMGVPRAVGLDVDRRALEVAAENARSNNLSDRLELVLGGPDVLSGIWPLVAANILAAPLIEMAPVLVRRVASGGRIILSGISSSVESEVRRTYQRLGMRCIRSEIRDGWAMLVVQASW